MNQPRRFNRRQRVVLYIAQDGKCASCGVELDPSFHADHITAWSRGGPTDVINGQALCPKCNLMKGNKNMDLRPWQKQAKRDYFTDSKQDWLLHVTPGGGKTTWALSIAKDLIQDGTVERIVVVVPSDSLRTQWTEHWMVKNRILNLMSVTNDEHGREKQSFHGCVVTYQQVASNPELYRMACRKKTLTIFDEAHHAGDSQSWGIGIEHAFELAERRIAMTGTPWRSPKRGKIPFIKYDSENKIITDFSFDYKQAIRGNVCRPVQFYPFDGEVTFINTKVDTCCMPSTEVARLGEAEDDNSEILKAILDANGKWMSSILQKASHTLNEIRNEISDAKGLIVVHDKAEARKVAKVIESITHEQPALVISDPEDGEPDPKEEIKRFSENKQKWVVAVDMISEGVDIPPLYVCVYATRKKTQLRFQQIVGRVVRKRPNDDLPAVVFIPATPKFLELASEIEKAILHVAEEIEQEINQERKERGEGENDLLEDDEDEENLVLSTSEAMRTGAIASGDSYHETELRTAEAFCLQWGIPTLYATNIAKKQRENGQPPEPDAPQSTQERTSLQEEYTKLRSLVNSQAKDVGGLIARRDGIDISIAIQKVQANIKKHFGKERGDMTIEELKSALLYVRKLRETILRKDNNS
jgi:superfamily II DNA or RNA helicase